MISANTINTTFGCDKLPKNLQCSSKWDEYHHTVTMTKRLCDTTAQLTEERSVWDIPKQLQEGFVLYSLGFEKQPLQRTPNLHLQNRTCAGCIRKTNGTSSRAVPSSIFS